MSAPPNRRLHEDGGTGSGSGGTNYSHPSVSKYPHEDPVGYSGGKVGTSTRHEYHATPYDMGQEGRMAKIASRNESREGDRRSPLLPNNMFRVSTTNDIPSDHTGSETRIDFRDSKDSNKETKADNRDLKSESREMHQTAKSDKYDSRADDNKESKHDRDAYSELKGNEKLDKDGYNGSSGQLNWKDTKEPHRLKYPDVPSDPWHIPRTVLHGSADVPKEGLHVDDRDFAESREAVGENRVDMKGDEKFKDKDKKRKEVKHWGDWGERDKERNDRRNNLQLGSSNSENREVVREDRESERWGELKEPSKEKEKPTERDHVKRELWMGADKEASHNEKEPMDIPGKYVEQESSNLEPKKKDHDTWKNVDREVRDKKKERDADVEPDRPDKRSRYHEKDPDEGGMHPEGAAEQEKEAFNCGVQQRKRMLRPRSSPQNVNRDPRYRTCANENEGSQGKADMSCVVYKIGECMQELIKLWKEYASSQADKASEGSQSGPTLEIRIPAEHVTATNRQVRGGQLWGTDVYTVDSDLVAVLMHAGYCRPSASPPPSSTQELRATIRVLPPQDCYISTLRNNVRSRAWGAAIGCSYRVEQCCIVKKTGGIIDLEACLTHSSTMEPTLAPVAVERTMTTRAAASNALRQQRFVREVTIQFNLCMEPWLKYSISVVADKGLKKSLFTSARLKKGEVLYVETHSCRYELCFIGEKVLKAGSATHAHGVEAGRAQSHNSHLTNGDKNTVDVESTVVDIFRWSRCKRPLPQKTMQSIGIPLPLEHIEVVEDNLEWDDISWSQTGAWIGGKEYHLARAHFLSPN